MRVRSVDGVAEACLCIRCVPPMLVFGHDTFDKSIIGIFNTLGVGSLTIGISMIGGVITTIVG